MTTDTASEKKTGRTDLKVQRRHWMFTIQAAHLGLEGDFDDGTSTTEVTQFIDEMEEAWSRVEADPRVRFACGQVERGEGTDRLHGQVYVEFTKSLRNAQVRKLLPAMAEPRRGSRTQCRDYCRKADTRVYALPDLGDWTPERGDGSESSPGPKALALQMLVQDGMTPAEIAQSHPEVFFQFHGAIKATWAALQEAKGFLECPTWDEPNH